MNRCMNRRSALLALLALAVFAFGSQPFATLAQPAQRPWRVGVVYGGSPLTSGPYQEAFLSGMKERGYEIGRNLVFDVRYADAKPERYPALVDEILALRPDVLIGASSPVALQMKAKTSTIPIVLSTAGDPVGDGLVQSLARPGGNVTGNSSQVVELGAKHIDVLAELLPRMRRVVLYLDLSEPPRQIEAYDRFVRSAAAARGLLLEVERVAGREDIRRSFQRMEANLPDALMLMPSARLNSMRREISQAAAHARLPSISFIEDYAQDGGLLSYGPSWIELNRRVAYFVDRIFKGARAGELPIEQPTKFSLVINAKTARSLGVEIPKAMLLRADRVIE